MDWEDIRQFLCLHDFEYKNLAFFNYKTVIKVKCVKCGKKKYRFKLIPCATK